MVRRWLGLLCVLALVLGWAVPGAAGGEPTLAEALAALQGAGIVQGDASGDLRTGDPITRAELVKVLVVAAGRGQEAARWSGPAPFPDVPAGHWSAGYVALARAMGLVHGYADGTFRPGQPVTAAEAIRLVLALAGLGPDGSDWPGAWVRAALHAGFLPPDLAAADPDRPATRGEVFLVAHRAFLWRGPGGTSVYDRLAGAAPAPGAPPHDGAGQSGVGGTAAGGTQTGSAHGGERAGERVPVAAIRAPDRIEVTVGEAVVVQAAAVDAAGRDLPQVPLAGQSDVGRYDPETRTFHAQTRPGTGVLTLSAGGVTRQVAVAVRAGPPARVQVLPPEVRQLPPGGTQPFTAQVVDRFGNPVQGGVEWSVMPNQGAGIEHGLFMATRPGRYTVRAVAGDAVGVATVRVCDPPAQLRLEVPGQLVANDATEVQVTVSVRDAAGQPVVCDYPGQVQLYASAPEFVAISTEGPLEDGVQRFRIRSRGGALAAGRTVRLTARAVGGPNLVEAHGVVQIVAPVAQQVRLAAPPYLPATAGARVPVQVMIVDQGGQPVAQGSYTVRLRVEGPARFPGGATELALPWLPGAGGHVWLEAEGTPGLVQITAAVEGLAGDRAEVAAVPAGPAAALAVQADAQVARAAGADMVEFTVQVVDSRGVPTAGPVEATVTVAGGGDQVRVAVRQGASYGPFVPVRGPVAVPLVGGTGALRVQAWEYTGPVTLTAAAPGLAEGAAGVQFVPGPPVAVAWRGPAVVVVPASRPEAAVQVQALDAAGNPVTEGGIGLRLGVAAGAPQLVFDLPSGRTVRPVQGAQFASEQVSWVALKVAGSGPGDHSVRIDQARYPVQPGRPAAVTLRVVPEPPATVAVAALAGGEPAEAVRLGVPLTVRAQVTDAQGKPVTGLVGKLTLVTLGGRLDTADISFREEAEGVYIATVTPALARDRMEFWVLADVGGLGVAGSVALPVAP